MSDEMRPGLPPLDDRAGAATVMFFLLCLALVGGFGYWAWKGTLDIVSVAAGEVTPSSQIQSVQHLEGGIVREIAVAEGAEVKAGQPLITLEQVRSGADRDEVQLRVSSLAIDIARLVAEAEGRKAPQFSAPSHQAHPALIERAMTLFKTRRQGLDARLAGQHELIKQRAQEIKELKVRLAGNRKSLKLASDQVKLSEELLKENLTVEFKHLELVRQQRQLLNQIESDKAALPRAEAALKEARHGITALTRAFQADAREELKEAERSRAELSQRLVKFEDSLSRTVLRAPMDGIVKTVHVKTIGGVVKPGDTVVDLVPLDDRLIVEAQLPVQDIGYVSKGQAAVIKLNSPDLARFGGLDGRVSHISPDKLVRDDGLPYYRVRIETDKDYFEKGQEQYRLFPGTQVLASIQTGHRTVIEYLLDPFLSSMGDALRER